jgi:hypothetical protein
MRHNKNPKPGSDAIRAEKALDAARLIDNWISKQIGTCAFRTSLGNLGIGGRAGLFFAGNAGRTVQRTDKSGANIRG